MRDSGILIGIAMLIVWGIGTMLEWSGWVHALLTGGVFLIVWRMTRKTN